MLKVRVEHSKAVVNTVAVDFTSEIYNPDFLKSFFAIVQLSFAHSQKSCEIKVCKCNTAENVPLLQQIRMSEKSIRERMCTT